MSKFRSFFTPPGHQSARCEPILWNSDLKLVPCRDCHATSMCQIRRNSFFRSKLKNSQVRSLQFFPILAKKTSLLKFAQIWYLGRAWHADHEYLVGIGYFEKWGAQSVMSKLWSFLTHPARAPKCPVWPYSLEFWLETWIPCRDYDATSLCQIRRNFIFA